MKKLKNFLPPIFLVSVLLPAVLFVFSKQIPGFASSVYNFRNELHILSDVFALVQKDYVEEVQPKRLVGGALNGLLTSLDPYSQFLSKEAYEEIQQDTHGEFVGIGVEVTLRGGLLRVIAPLDGSPAQRAGVKPGDAIIKIDEAVTRDMTLNDAVKKMKGPPGTVVKLSLMHEEAHKLFDVSILREVIKIKSVKEAKRLDDGIGYVRLSAFQENSAKDLEEALNSLQSEGMQGLLLDIRNNAGGLLTAAVEVSELFVPEGQLIVSTRGRNPKKNNEYFSKSKKVFTVKPLVILVNKGSASSSEILAGAIQDFKLGTIVGGKTFGKGSIQSLIPLDDGTAIRMTTSRYYTPAGRLIHEKGIAPDVEVEAGEDKEGTDIPLERAIEVLKELRKNLNA